MANDKPEGFRGVINDSVTHSSLRPTTKPPKPQISPSEQKGKK